LNRSPGQTKRGRSEEKSYAVTGTGKKIAKKGGLSSGRKSGVLCGHSEGTTGKWGGNTDSQQVCTRAREPPSRKKDGKLPERKKKKDWQRLGVTVQKGHRKTGTMVFRSRKKCPIEGTTKGGK